MPALALDARCLGPSPTADSQRSQSGSGAETGGVRFVLLRKEDKSGGSSSVRLEVKAENSPLNFGWAGLGAPRHRC